MLNEELEPEEYDIAELPYTIPNSVNITIDNISITCDNIILAAKIVILLRNHDIHKDVFDFDNGKEAIKELEKLEDSIFKKVMNKEMF